MMQDTICDYSRVQLSTIATLLDTGQASTIQAKKYLWRPETYSNPHHPAMREENVFCLLVFSRQKIIRTTDLRCGTLQHEEQMTMAKMKIKLSLTSVNNIPCKIIVCQFPITKKILFFVFILLLWHVQKLD